MFLLFYLLYLYVMKDKKLNIRIKSKLFITCVLPVLMYGSQTWTLRQKNIGKLANCQHAIDWRLSVKKSDRLKSKVIRNKTKVHDNTHKLKDSSGGGLDT